MSESQFPLTLGAPEDFAGVRSALEQASYNEATLCRELKIDALSHVGDVSSRSDAATLLQTLDAPLGVLVKLLLFADFAARDEVETTFDAETLAAFINLGVLKCGEYQPDKYHATVLLYPVTDLYIASDRSSHPDGSHFTATPDIVFPAIYTGTLRFLRLLPAASQASNVLDLCAGSGVGALLLAQRNPATQAVSSDLTARATHFAEFNRRLNRVENMRAVESDLYVAFAGEKFDLIVAHPPYMPTLREKMIYRDAGDAGERLLRSIVERMPEHLQAGGIGYALGIGFDTTDATFERRVRGWLGEAQQEFDLIFAVADEKTPRQAAFDIAAAGRDVTYADIPQLHKAFTDIGATRMCYGALILRRRSDSHEPPATLRVKLSSDADGADFLWLLDWIKWRAREDFAARLSTARPAVADNLLVEVTHAFQDGSLVPADFILKIQRPFPAATRVDGWVVPLLAGFDGASTVNEVYGTAKTNETLPDDFTLDDFLKLVTLSIERGYLRLDVFA